METLQRWATAFRSFWSSLRLWQRISLFLTAFLVLGALSILVLAAGRTAYEPLFAGLDPQDQAAIVSYLKENGKPYRLDPAADAILLPRGDVYETRLALAQEGLPKGGGVGFELFDDSRMGMSEFQQRIAYIRAIEGELARTIQQMDAVEHARISVVIPEQRLFLEQQKPSTASVLLRLRSGATLGQAQVKSIIHLVSHSVDGLQPDQVTVVDTTGRILSDMLSDDMILYPQDGQGSVTSLQRELERQRERELELKVRTMLEQVFGPGTAVVKVQVELDFDKKSNSSVVYQPLAPDNPQGIPRSRETGEESYTGVGQAVNGTPGTTTNIPGYAIQAQPVNSEYNKTNTTTNYEITTHKSDQVFTPGGVRRLTASVLIDGEIDEAGLRELRETISTAIGYSEARGDALVVKSMKFSTAFAEAMAEEMRQERMWRIASGSFAVLIILLLLALAFWWWSRRRKERMRQQEVQEEGKKVPTIQEMLTSPDLLAFQGELAVLEEQLKAYAKNNPEEVANLVNEWLSDDD